MKTKELLNNFILGSTKGEASDLRIREYRYGNGLYYGTSMIGYYDKPTARLYLNKIKIDSASTSFTNYLINEVGISHIAMCEDGFMPIATNL